MAVNLTPRTVAGLKPREVQYGVLDSNVPGLELRVTPNGVKTWSVRYRVGRRQRRMTIGSANVLKLAEARKRARDAVKSAGDGVDPAAIKRERSTADTFGELANLYIEKHAKRTKRTWKEDERMLRVEVLPAWKSMAARSITRRDVRELIERIADRPAPIQANRVLALVRKVFNVAIDREVVEANPAARLARPGKERQRDRVLTDDEIRKFWTALEAQPLEMAAFFKLRLLTAQRGGEVASMRWSDVDVVGCWWTIPAEAAKNGLAHRVPLTPTVVSILKLLKERTDQRRKQFEDRGRELSTRESERLAYVLADARGKRQRADTARTFGLENFKGHDLRRTAASQMTSVGVSRLVVSKVLNHVEKGVTAVYDRHSYDAEKRAALETWERRLTAILEQRTDISNVLAFSASR